MLIRRTLLPTIAVALALVPAATAAATPSGGFEPPPGSPSAGGQGDIYPVGYPVAVLEVPSASLLHRQIQFVLDASTGLDIVSQELRIYEPDGTLVFGLRAYEPPSPDVWANYWPDTTGIHTVTLTVTTAAGYVDSIEHEFLVWRVPEPTSLPPL